MDLFIALKIHYTKLQCVPSNSRYIEENTSKNLLKKSGWCGPETRRTPSPSWCRTEETVEVTEGHSLTSLLFY